MKHLLTKAATALLAAPLLVLMVQDAPASVSAGAAAPSPAVVAQARANFIHMMSSHAPAVGVGGWLSPGPKLGGIKTANGGVTGLESYNWDGFANSESGSNTITSASGSWTIPAVQCLPQPYQNQDAFLSDWVGLDGLTDGTVEQLGTATQCYEGVEYYYVWYEMFPAGTVEEGTTACINDNVDCPQPGDQVTASVTVTPAADGNNSYTLALTDHTRPQESFSVTQSCAATTCVDSSAEWIVERPAFSLPFGFQILPLGSFGTSTFSAATVVSAGHFSTSANFNDGPVYDLAMIDDSAGYILACNDQPAPPGTLLSASQASSCPTVSPSHRSGGFETSWDSSF